MAQGLARARGSEDVGDDGHGIGACIPADGSIVSRDAADGNERTQGEGAGGPESIETDGGVGAMLGVGGEDGAEGDVIDGQIGSVAHLCGVMGGEAEEGVGADDEAGIGGSEIVLTEMEAGAEEHGAIGAVIDDEAGAGFAAEGGEAMGEVEGFAAPEILVAKLEDAGTAFEAGFGGGEGVEGETVEGRSVENRVDAREQLHDYPRCDVRRLDERKPLSRRVTLSHMRGWLLSVVLMPGLAMAAVPTIQSVTDSAGYGPRVAPGSLATLFGTGLASDTVTASTFPLSTTAGGASVSVGGTLAPLLYVSAGQINFQVPSSAASGEVNVVVNGPGGTSAAFSMTVTAEAPALYQYGTNRALAQNADGTLNSGSAPAASGSVITVYLTGQGAVSNPVTDGTAAPDTPLSSASAQATATIGLLNAPVQFLGLTPEFAGLAQANIQVPTLAAGDYPLVLTVGGFISASGIISVSGSGTYTSPLTLTGSVSFANSDASSIVLYSNIAYVCGDNNITMVDVTKPSAPGVIGSFGNFAANVPNGTGERCVINGQVTTPYLVEIVSVPEIVNHNSISVDSFIVYSLANPRAPTLLTAASTTYGNMENLSFSGNYGFVTTSYITYQNNDSQIVSQTGDLLVFDFTNPAAPLFVTFMQATGAPGSGDQNLKPYSTVVDQIYSYVASSTATGASTTGTGILDVISIASPGAPTPLSQATVTQAAILLSFDIAGTTLLVAGNTAGQRNPIIPDNNFTGNLTLTAMNLSNVQLPAVVATLTTNLQVNGTYYTVAFQNVQGVFAIVNNPPDGDDFGPSSLMIVDARNTSNILLYPYQTQFGFNGILTTSNGYLLAPTSLGLNIYQLQL